MENNDTTYLYTQDRSDTMNSKENIRPANSEYFVQGELRSLKIAHL